MKGSVVKESIQIEEQRAQNMMAQVKAKRDEFIKKRLLDNEVIRQKYAKERDLAYSY